MKIIRPTRVATVLSVAALGAAMATPTIDQAMASSSGPALPDVSAALAGAGISAANVSAITNELAAVRGVAPGGTLPTGSLNALDNALTQLNGGLLGSLLNPVAGLLLALNPAAASNLNAIAADLQQIGSAPGASTAVKQAVAELTAALRTAALGQSLTQIGGLSSAQNGSALAALAGLQSIPLGGSAPAGSLAPVGTVLTTLAGEGGVPASAASSLNNAAAILNGSGAVSPAQLITAVGDVQAAAGSMPSPLNGIASSLASQLADATSVFGQLSSVGNAVPGGTVGSGLSGLGALPSLPLGASVPAGSLSSVGGVLSSVASEPGVSASAAGALNSAASALSGGGPIGTSTLVDVVQQLQSAAGLPSPLDGLVTEINKQLASAGSIFGGVPGLSPSQITGALAALQSLPSLPAGQPIPAGTLAPVGSVLSQIASQPGVPPQAASALSGVASTLSSGTVSPPDLSSAIAALQGVGDTLPAPLNSVVDQIAQQLSAAAALTGTGGSGGSGGGSGGGTGGGSGGGSGGSGGGSGGSGGGSGGSGGGSGGSHGSGGSSGSSGGSHGSGGRHPSAGRPTRAKFVSVKLSQRTLIVKLKCTAAAGRSCKTVVTVTQKGHRLLRKTITFRAGKTKTLRLRLAVSAAKAAAHHKWAVKVSARTGGYTVSRKVW